jgi:hypothetical protein
MELKFDGKSTVSGTVSGLPNPADVKTAPRSEDRGAEAPIGQARRRRGPSSFSKGRSPKTQPPAVSTGDEAGEFKITRKP